MIPESGRNFFVLICIIKTPKKFKKDWTKPKNNLYKSKAPGYGVLAKLSPRFWNHNMANIYVYEGDDKNFDELTGKTGADRYYIDGGILTIDTDTRYCLNSTPSTAAIDDLEMGVDYPMGECHILGDNVRLIPYDTGSGNVPAIGTTISQGGVSAELLGVWANLGTAPTTAGSSMPSSGFIKVKNKTGGNFSSGALTGIGATSNAADVTGWIEVVFFETGRIYIRPGPTFEIKGEWFYPIDTDGDLITTSGSRGQTVQLPSSLDNCSYPGVFIEDSAGSDTYTFWPNAGEMWSLTYLGTEQYRHRFVSISSHGLLQIGSDGSDDIGAMPSSGCKIRVPNIIFTSTNGTVGYDANSDPGGTYSNRPAINPSQGGIIDFDKAVFWALHPDLLSAASISITNCLIKDRIDIEECNSYFTMENCHIVQPEAATNYPSGYIFANKYGGKIKDCSSYLAYSSGYADCAFWNQYNVGIEYENIWAQHIRNPPSSRYGALGTNNCRDLLIDGITVIGGNMEFSTCIDCIARNVVYADRTKGAVNSTAAGYACEIGSSTNCLIEYVTELPGCSDDIHPWSYWGYITSSYDSTIRFLGTPTTPLTHKRSYPIYQGGNCVNAKFQRCYFTGSDYILSGTNTTKGMIIESCWGDYDTDIRNMNQAFDSVLRGIKGGAGTGSTNMYSTHNAVQGTHFIDTFVAADEGKIAIIFNQKTNAGPPCFSADSYEITDGAPYFGGNGTLYLQNSDDEIIYTWPWYIKGYTGFKNSNPYRGGAQTQNVDVQYKIDKNDGNGFSTTWKDATGANLSAETGMDAADGFKLKVKFSVNNADYRTYLNRFWFFGATDATSMLEALTYPLISESVTINITGLKTGSEVRIYRSSDGVELAGIESSGTSFAYEYLYEGSDVDVDIVIHALAYLPVRFDAITLSSSNQNLPIKQFVDRQYDNP
jgi:hypothetical protein